MAYNSHLLLIVHSCPFFLAALYLSPVFITRAAPAAAKQRNAFLDLLKLATAATMEAAQQGIFEANLHRQEDLTGHWENL